MLKRTVKAMGESTSNSTLRNKQKLVQNTTTYVFLVMRMSGTDAPDLSPRTLFNFHTQSDLDQFALGSDADIGGYSTVHLDLDNGKGKFWGDMRLDVKTGLKGKVRAGYAGFRNKVCALSQILPSAVVLTPAC
jgi:hypothetical protein